MNPKRNRGLKIQPEGLKLIAAKMREKGYTRTKLSNLTDLDIKTINTALQGENKDRDTIGVIVAKLDLELSDVVDVNELYREPLATVDVDWRTVCGAMLEDQQEKQRLRRQATEMGFEVDVHVPLGLLKRKKQQRRDENVERERAYELDENAIAQTYQHEDFLLEVIGNSNGRENRNIAIIGEPGAGKTTLLSAIASYIQLKTQQFPICISLASLEGKSLEDYLSETWLPKALALVNPEINHVETLHITSLRTRFRQGGVWLLLDGVDEMGINSPTQALETIQKELTDWIGQGRVVLTCRLNVWDAQIKPTLTGFDTYRLQQFNSEDIDNFITDWFNKAGNEQLGKQLQAKLKEPGKERICELVKHPLRLALLCHIFYKNEQAELPETKAGLYQLFTRYFYEWKFNFSLVDDITKVKLHQALGNLSLAGINSNARFRLKERLACQEIGGELFRLALDIGWLNIVDRDLKTDEAVYAFFHPTFQEYFAALAIDDWHYFFNHIPDKPAKGNYRVFENQWKEVILLWLGREDIPQQQKESFLMSIIEFEDGCKGFYRNQAFLVAAEGVTEFREFSHSDVIVEQLVNWSYGYFDYKKGEWRTIVEQNKSCPLPPIPLENPLESAARKILLVTDCSKSLADLTKHLLTNPYEKQSLNQEPEPQLIFYHYLLQILKNLREMKAQTPETIKALMKLLSGDDEDVCFEAAKFLLEIELQQPDAIRILNDMLNSERWEIRINAAQALLEVKCLNSSTLSRVANMLINEDWNELSKSSFFNKTYMDTAMEINKKLLIITDNQPIISNLFDELKQVYQKIEKKWQIFLIDQASKPTDIDFDDPFDSNYIYHPPTLTNQEILKSVQTLQSGKLVGYDWWDNYLSLRIKKNHPLKEIVFCLKDCISDEIMENDRERYWICWEGIWECVQYMSYPEFYQAWHGIDPNVEAFTNQFTDINALLKQLQPTDNTYPIPVNARVLETETDKSSIAQALCNRIYQAALPDNPETIPEVNNVFQLERSLFQLRNQLQVQNLALIIYSCEPQPALINFSRQLIDVVHIAWITNQPIEPPLYGFTPDQPHLISALQNWMDRLIR